MSDSNCHLLNHGRISFFARDAGKGVTATRRVVTLYPLMPVLHRKLPVDTAQASLDNVVLTAHGFSAKAGTLEALLKLNGEVAATEARGLSVTGPGLPTGTSKKFVTSDSLKMP